MNLELDNTEALAEKADRRQFTDLVERMLSLDPDTRITPKDAANHNFMKLKHLDRYDFCRHVRHSVEVTFCFCEFIFLKFMINRLL